MLAAAERLAHMGGPRRKASARRSPLGEPHLAVIEDEPEAHERVDFGRKVGTVLVTMR